MKKLDKIKDYYNDTDAYLKEHSVFLANAKIDKEIKFLKKSLTLKKTERILDVACGQGRHANYLASKGYLIDGVDFSKTLLNLAKEKSGNLKNKPRYFLSNILNFRPEHKYKKVYWLFADLAQIKIDKIATSLERLVAKEGILLLDFDNIFRLVVAISKREFPNLQFDAFNCRLHDKETDTYVPFLTAQQWIELFKKKNFSFIRCYGNYDGQEYNLFSPRIIMTFKKTA